MRLRTGDSECADYLSAQLITYIGNKRSLLDFIGGAVDTVKEALGQDQLVIADLFSGSGVVSRFLKQSAKSLYANDFERYTYTLNRCYLTDAPNAALLKRLHKTHEKLIQDINASHRRGFIAKLYAPEDGDNIRLGDRCFFTPRNAAYIDTARQLMEEIPEELRHYFIAPLLTEVSVKNNTSGVFKGFYKNSRTGIGQYGGNGRDALSRITRDIEVPFPVFSRSSCPVNLYCEDANVLAGQLPPMDLAYLDPPYNQHPYGSNYFMLNLVNDYKEPAEISDASGIPTDWNRSVYNKPKPAFHAFSQLCDDLDTKFILISFNSEGFIKKDQMLEMLSELGETAIIEKTYNTFRGSRNLRGRDLHVKEFLFLVDKRKV